MMMVMFMEIVLMQCDINYDNVKDKWYLNLNMINLIRSRDSLRVLYK